MQKRMSGAKDELVKEQKNMENAKTQIKRL